MPTLKALPTTDVIEVDGLFDEAVWEKAESGTRFTQREPQAGSPSTERTEFKVLYTPRTLYVGVWAYDSDPDAIIAQEKGRDAALFRDDSVLVVLDTFHDRRNAFFFETNPNAARTDLLITDEGRDFNLAWDGIWEVATNRTEQGWTAEFAIPFSTLRFDPEKDTWGLNVRRLVRRKNEESYWAPIGLDATVARISLSGELQGLHQIGGQRNLFVKPFVVGDTRRLGGTESEENFDGGLDVKWSLARDLTLDVTINTDFAETELDNQEVNITRFPLFFPERREFFLENEGIFEFGTGDRPVNRGGALPLFKVFHSRRIGIAANGEKAPIDFGARLTGRVGDWSLGVLNAQTDSVGRGAGAEPSANWSVLRLKRNLGERSNVGMVFTNQDPSGSYYNRVTGFDADFAPNRFSVVNAYVVRSDDQILDTDYAAGVAGAWQGPEWGWRVNLSDIGDDFDPGTGFLLRRGRNYASGFTFQPRQEENPRIRNYFFGADVDVFTTGDDQLETVDVVADLFGIRFESEDQVGIFVDASVERIFAPFSPLPGLTIAPGRYEFAQGGGIVTTNPGRKVFVEGAFRLGKFFDGDLYSHGITVRYRPTNTFQIQGIWGQTDIENPTGGASFNEYRTRLAFAFTPNLLVNAFLQYTDIIEQASMNLRLNWIYKPGADIFLVYNEIWDAPSATDLDSRDRQVILKMTYLVGF